MKFRRKPVVVDAVQFWPDQQPWPQGVFEIPRGWHERDRVRPPMYSLQSERYGAAVKPGDWVVTNQTGERYVVPNVDFFEVFERIPEGSNG